MRLPIILALMPTLAFADPRVDAALDTHILPAFEQLSMATKVLADAQTCAPHAEWQDVTQAWLAVSHLRFGPTEADNRAFGLAFWPDPRGATPKALRTLLEQDPPDVRTASIAGRGVYALEFLLYDPAFVDDPRRCDVIKALAEDARTTADEINLDWQVRYADLMRGAGHNDTYQSEAEAVQELYKALLTGLQFASDTRLGRPLGTFERPRPKRAEMRRSERSLANLGTSLISLRTLASILAQSDTNVQAAVDETFARALSRAQDISTLTGGADLSLVSDPIGRLKVEILQQDIDHIREVITTQLGPLLGVDAGFNALDGD